jgi:transposase
MPKPYSQDLRDRVIDAVERGKMSRRAAARRYEVSESVAINGLSGLNGTARKSLSGTAATGLPSWRRTVIFWKLRAPRSRTSRFRRFAIAFCPSETSKPTLR